MGPQGGYTRVFASEGIVVAKRQRDGEGPEADS
jgi:hypothetical protein